MARPILILLISVAGVAGSASTSRAGTVTGVTASAAALAAGATLSVTVTGSNPCGAAHINYGDGVAITYAITGLPTTQTHSYDKPGTYTITAQGMGNCDGSATTKVTVTSPPDPQQPAPPQPPPPGAAQITAVNMQPIPGRVGEPVTIAVEGRGSCSYEVHYGDGNAQEVTGVLPQQFRHTYARADTFVVIVKPVAPCTGKFTQQLPVVEANTAVPRIVRLLLSPSPADAGQPVAIAIEGTGTCAYTMDFGDGNSESRSAALPDRLRHTYPAAGTYALGVVPERPCTGSARASVVVRGAVVGGITGVEITPNPVALNARATFEIKGTGGCRVAMNYGDGTTQMLSGVLPLRIVHVYSVPGRYAVQAKAEAPCTGDMRADLEVRDQRP